jgi:endonuclease/exonuclease/phosphatase family metal-dependent hydrolase
MAYSRSLFVVLISAALFLVGCDQQSGPLEQIRGTVPAAHSGQGGMAVSGSGEPIRIASFNIQVFGTSKAGKPEVMDILAQVVRNFDVVAIQELRTTDPSVLENFVRLINQKGAAYQYVVGPRLGRTVSKEQYVFVFDSRRVELLPNTLLTLEDPHDLLHREPLIGRFQVRTNDTGPPFTFILVNVHTDPDETDTELDALGEAFVAVQQNPWGEDDVILLGDLNVDYAHLGMLGRLPDIACTVHGEPTNTRGSKSYDNIVFNERATVEFTGKAAVFDLLGTYGLTKDQALKVSDHMPVWAEFHALEGGAQPLLADRNSSAGGSTGPSAATGQPTQPQPTPTGTVRGVVDRVREESREFRSRLPQMR